MGRTREAKNGPRILDLDIILYEGFKSESFELTVPHPRLLERAFVMAPLNDLFPGGRAPGIFFGPYLRDLGMQGVESSIMENEQTEKEDNGLTSAFADWQPKFEEQFEEVYKVPVDHYEEIKDGFYTVYAEKDGEVVPFVTLDAKSGVYEEIAEDR